MDILAHRRALLPCPMGIYCITHLPTGRRYIGSSSDMRDRCLHHRAQLIRGNHHNHALQQAWVASGAASFTFTVLDYVDDYRELATTETQWMHATSSLFNALPAQQARARPRLLAGPLPRVSLAVSRLEQIELLPRTIERFWSYVDRGAGGDACWLWTGARQPWGYGMLSIRVLGRWTVIVASRFSYLLAHGAITPRLMVCHNCPGGDQPACVNPAHLWMGTMGQNTADRHAKGRTAHGERHMSRTHPERLARGQRNGRHTKPERTARGERHSSRTHPERIARGERHGSHVHPERLARGENVNTAKLTAQDVRDIRAAFARGGVSKAALGRSYGVSTQSIWAIIERRSWAHID